MTTKAASKKANVSNISGKSFYRQYLKDNNLDVFVPKRITQSQKNKLIGYIFNDKMSLIAASKRANMSHTTTHKYYHEYLNNNNIESFRISMAQEKTKQLISYIVDYKMSVRAASIKVNVSPGTGMRHYRHYLNDQKRDASTPSP
jgi:hypothetical protein